MAAFDNPLVPRRTAGYPEATRRLKRCVRDCLHLADDVAVSVTELACFAPGCAGLETVIGILPRGGSPRIGRVHKRIPEIDAADIEAAFPEAPNGTA